MPPGQLPHGWSRLRIEAAKVASQLVDPCELLIRAAEYGRAPIAQSILLHEGRTHLCGWGIALVRLLRCLLGCCDVYVHWSCLRLPLLQDAAPFSPRALFPSCKVQANSRYKSGIC